MMVEVVIIILHSDTTILNPHHHGSLFAWSTIHISCEQPTTRSEDYVHGVLHHQHCKIHLATSSQNTLCCLPLFLRHHRRTYIHCTPPVLSLHAQVPWVRRTLCCLPLFLRHHRRRAESSCGVPIKSLCLLRPTRGKEIQVRVSS